MKRSSSSFSRPKIRGYYETVYTGIDKVPRGFTAHEYMRICNCLPSMGVLRRSKICTMLRRQVSILDFTYLAGQLRRDGRLSGYEALPSSPVKKRRRRLRH